jgi:hypothetical protein
LKYVPVSFGCIFEPIAVPEPTSLSQLGSGLVGCRLPKSYPKPKSQYHGVEIKQLSGLS